MATFKISIDKSSLNRQVKLGQDKFRAASRKVTLEYGATVRRELYRAYGYRSGSLQATNTVMFGKTTITLSTWRPLSTRWLATKRTLGLSNKFYKATGQLQSAVIGRIESETATTTTYVVGLDKNKMMMIDPVRPRQSKSGAPRTVYDKFMMNEYGPLRGGAEGRPIYRELMKAATAAYRLRLLNLASMYHFKGANGVMSFADWVDGLDSFAADLDGRVQR